MMGAPVVAWPSSVRLIVAPLASIAAKRKSPRAAGFFVQAVES